MRRAALCLLAVLAVAAGAVWMARRPPGPVLYVGGPIVTMDAEGRIAEALATDGAHIVAVGREAQLRPWAAQRGARVVDLAGAALLPGFIDAHGHFPGSGLYAVVVDLQSPPVGAVRTMDDLVSRLAARAHETRPGSWVVGHGYDDLLLAERRHPTRHDLDRVSRDHPVVAIHISGHLAVVNSAGLAALGLSAATPDPEGGRIRREADGRTPDGVLEETAMAGVEPLLEPGPMGALHMLRAASRLYVAAGVTTAQSGYTPAHLLRAFDWASRLGLVAPRLVLWPDAAAAQALLRGELDFTPHDPEWVRLGAVKLIADGSIQGYTGYLREPYFVPPGDDPAYRGYPRIPRDELAAQVARFHAAGMQIAIHGNGDAAIDDILDALEAAQRAHPRADARPVVIHAQMAREDQLDRMAALGVIPSFFVLHTYYWGDRHRRIFLGPERAARISPAASARRRAIPFTLHADAPVVPMEPLRIAWAAVNRRTRSGFVLGPEQRIRPDEALRAITLDAARQHFEEDRKGSLEPGKLADLVILERSPLEDAEHMDEIRVLATVIGGRAVYRAAEGPG